jgi:N-acetylmuramoyl-L-alanine amidase
VLLCAAGAAAALTFRSGQPEYRPVSAPPHSGFNVIIDAGHGGPDGGAVSRTGFLESHINLAIALRLEMLYNLYGYAPVMTRRTDISIHDSTAETIRQKKMSDLRNRVDLVNKTENALLISIHQNTFSNGRYYGAQCFYGKHPDSEALAAVIQNGLIAHIDPDNKRDIKPIPGSVYLFSHINSPSVLIECGFLSNDAEANKLINGTYQTKLAASIFSSYLQWS